MVDVIPFSALPGAQAADRHRDSRVRHARLTDTTRHEDRFASRAPITVSAPEPSAPPIAAPAVQTARPVHGVVVSLSAGSITLDPSGTTRTITVNAATKYFVGRSPATEAAVVPGEFVIATGTVDPNGTFTATTVNVLTPPPPEPSGPTIAQPTPTSRSFPSSERDQVASFPGPNGDTAPTYPSGGSGGYSGGFGGYTNR